MLNVLLEALVFEMPVGRIEGKQRRANVLLGPGTFHMAEMCSDLKSTIPK